MPLNQALLAEFQHEAATTRKLLERVPMDKLEWQPHPKSMTLRRLAGHVAEVNLWAVQTLTADEFDTSRPDAKKFFAPEFKSSSELLEFFDKGVKDTIAALINTDDDAFGRPWSLKSGGHTAFTLPKAMVMRSFVMNHMIHHRAQLGVYLRLLDVPVPSMYGPSADER